MPAVAEMTIIATAHAARLLLALIDTPFVIYVCAHWADSGVDGPTVKMGTWWPPSVHSDSNLYFDHKRFLVPHACCHEKKLRHERLAT